VERGWRVVAVFEDNDISAYSGRPRPGYRALLEAIGHGEIDVVVAWHGDRLHRRPVELEEYIMLCEQQRVTTHTVQAGFVDLASASGQMVARVVGAMSRYESQHKGDRVRRARQQAAQAGKAHGPLGFGYQWDAVSDRWRVVEDEAATVREIADRILTGETLGGICRDLNRRGVATPRGGFGWRPSNVRPMIAGGRYCGYREYTPGSAGQRGRGRGFGPLVAQGVWPPILTKETTEQIRVLLSDPKRTAKRVRSYLLSGILRCGKCGAKMNGSTDNRTGKHRYVCAQQPGLNRCGKTVISGPPTDELVTGMVLASLGGVPPAAKRSDAAAADDDALTHLNAISDQLQDYMRQKIEGRLTSEEWSTARELLLRRRDELEDRIRTSHATVARRLLPSSDADIQQAWRDAAPSRQRAILTAVVGHVTVLPRTSPGGNRFDPSRLEVTWIA